MPGDETARPAATGYPHAQPQPQRNAFLADHLSHHRGSSGTQAGLPHPLNTSVWTYALEPTATGTRLVETRHAENGVTAVSTAVTKAALGGVDTFEKELLEGMNQSLARIKAAAEAH